MMAGRAYREILRRTLSLMTSIANSTEMKPPAWQAWAMATGIDLEPVNIATPLASCGRAEQAELGQAPPDESALGQAEFSQRTVGAYSASETSEPKSR